MKIWQKYYSESSRERNRASPGGSLVKNPPVNAGRCGFDLWVRKIPWNRKWQPTPVFLPKKYHGQRNLAGYTVQRVTKSHKESQRVGRWLGDRARVRWGKNSDPCCPLVLNIRTARPAQKTQRPVLTPKKQESFNLLQSLWLLLCFDVYVYFSVYHAFYLLIFCLLFNS